MKTSSGFGGYILPAPMYWGSLSIHHIITRRDIEAIDKMLLEAGYKKTSDGYVKGSKFEHRRTRCRVTSGTPHTLTFTKEYNQVE